LVLAKDYGAPQNRPRVLVVGVRDDVDISAWEKINSKVANGFLPKPTYDAPDLIDLLGDLVDPKFKYGGSTDNYLDKASNKYQKLLRTGIDGKVAPKGAILTEQEYSNHSEKVIEKFTYMLKHNGAIPPHLKTKKFAQRLLPARWGDSGPSITATSLPDDYVHFSQARIPTVREWARLQGFPDWYQFAGSRTTGGLRRAGNPQEGMFDRELPKYTQIGNAVPVYLAEQVGLHFSKVL
jgi:DNA (cytosine-5)-methyltransferase 1